VSSSLTGQRSRSELIAELYERHAAGLFAYCHDQLGESTSAGDAVVAVFTGVPTVQPPPRAALYALARREIYRRDVSYALPSVDSVADPATALIERVFRDIRPHQREVLLLSAVCGLNTPEIAVVLDVAADTAEELTFGAQRRFVQTLETATAAARSAPYVAADVAEVYDAIGVAPVADILARLPWRRPVAAVRGRVLSSLLLEEPGMADGSLKLSAKKLWPTTPTWPLPLSNPDQATDTVLVQTDSIATSEPRRRAKHEAMTEPMPKLRGSILNALGEGRTRRRRAPQPAPVASAPAEADATFDAFRPVEPEAAQDTEISTTPANAAQATSQATAGTSAPPEPAAPAETDQPESEPAAAVEIETPGQQATKPGVRPKKRKNAKAGERHYDWLWELVGFLICLAIALIVFFSVPTIVTP
jgi:DNA-directed RNA polymerase specialized sigma24 family protein